MFRYLATKWSCLVVELHVNNSLYMTHDSEHNKKSIDYHSKSQFKQDLYKERDHVLVLECLLCKFKYHGQ